MQSRKCLDIIHLKLSPVRVQKPFLWGQNYSFEKQSFWKQSYWNAFYNHTVKV